MLKDVVSWIDYSFFDEIALIIFAVCFLAIVAWALSLRKETTHKYGSIPMNEDVVDPKPSQSNQSTNSGRNPR
jgi:cbb3-type cytochrome oxidase subunit 3